MVNICIIFHILFCLLLDAQSKMSKHVNGFVAHCMSQLAYAWRESIEVSIVLAGKVEMSSICLPNPLPNEIFVNLRPSLAHI